MMSDTTVRLLHVEDDSFQHRALLLRLRSAPGMVFDTTWTTREDDALKAFAESPFDLVIMDYVLAEGDGLDLLRRLRARDQIVPIIAVSGTATSAVALELIQAGADDYFDKSAMDSGRFVRSIRESLDRATKLRERAAKTPPTDLVAALCQDFTARLGADFAHRLDAVEHALRTQVHSPADLQGLFLQCHQSGGEGAAGTSDSIRPLVLEFAFRLFGPSMDDAAFGHG
jgi:CheY-like chemotaxis protein